MSSGKFSAPTICPRPPGAGQSRGEVLSYRAHFAGVWQRFVTQNFESPVHAAHVFQVDATTAEKWWRGLNAPSGWVVGRAIADPDLRGPVLALLAGDA